MYLIEAIKSSIKRAIQYRANLASWILADIGLYLGMILGYFFLSDAIETFGEYTKDQIMLYINTFAVINNLYAVFFAEGVSQFGDSIISGRYAYYMLKPRLLLKNYVYMHLNIPALFSTPFLWFLECYFISRCGLQVTGGFIFAVISATINMGLLFSIIACLSLFGWRSEALTSIMIQLLSIAEKPDTVFPKAIRKILLYIIPVFLFSAFPMHIVLSKSPCFEKFWGFSSPLVFASILTLIYHIGKTKYQSTDE